MYSIIVPTAHNDRALRTLFYSLERYTDPTLHTVILISPHPISLNTTVSVQYMCDTDLVPLCPDRLGWHTQQMVKLAIATVVTTDVYLVLDSDMALTVPLTYTDLVYNNRIAMHTEPYPTSNSKHFSQNTTWWSASARLWGVDVPTDANALMAATPQVLSTPLVRMMCSALPCTLEEALRRGCTEFTLYWTYLMKHQLTWVYTPTPFSLWTPDLTRNVLAIEDATPDVVDTAFTSPTSCCIVLQSYLPVNHAPYLDKCDMFLRRQSLDAVFLCASALTPSRSQFFSVEDRLRQTVNTARQIQARVPRSKRILIEGTPLTPAHRDVLRQHYDIVLEPTGLEQYVNHSGNIAHGECALLRVGIEYLRTTLLHNYDPLRIVKMGTRYSLNDQFRIDQYSTRQYTFRQHIDTSLQQPVYTTGLFSLSMRQLNAFHRLLCDVHEDIDTVGMIERVYHQRIPRHDVHLVHTLGLEGRLSYHGNLFKV